MTPQERDLLTRFLADLDRARGVQKDAEADALIARAMAANPDAAYLLVQHAIVSDQALRVAQARIAELEDQLGDDQPQRGGSFLPAGPWGGGSAPAASVPPTVGTGAGTGAGSQGGFFSGGGGLGSFLRTAGATAAGVAGGQMLFEGMSNLFGNHGGWDRGSGFLGGAPENVTINDYGGGDDGPDRLADGADFDDLDVSGDWN